VRSERRVVLEDVADRSYRSFAEPCRDLCRGADLALADAIDRPDRAVEGRGSSLSAGQLIDQPTRGRLDPRGNLWRYVGGAAVGRRNWFSQLILPSWDGWPARASPISSPRAPPPLAVSSSLAFRSRHRSRSKRGRFRSSSRASAATARSSAASIRSRPTKDVMGVHAIDDQPIAAPGTVTAGAIEIFARLSRERLDP